MNIYDVSKKAGVSTATVSRVINGSGKVSEETRRRILAIMDEVSYTPSTFARKLGSSSTMTIGIMCVDSSDPFFARAVNLIDGALKENNYETLMHCTGYELANKQKSVKRLLASRVDAIIMVGSSYVESEENAVYIKEAAKELPVMMVNGVLRYPNVYNIASDDKDAAYQITARFIESGRRNLIYLYDSANYSGIKKLSGFALALEQAGIEPKEDRMILVGKVSRPVENAKARLMELKGMEIDGIVTANDLLAAGALKFAKEIGVSVPEQMFISGFDNSNIACCCDPELTSIDNKLEPICATSVATLLGVLEGRDMPKTTLFSSAIIERGTTRLKP
ncbi:MAG: LacI family transcriptional regulator [Clostridiales bacterium]|jgi:LacI family transcriptional regulator/LacI family asc operon transcriptional repressor|nr:LacI family transcriptional regulator [Clostridiales bacterium]